MRKLSMKYNISNIKIFLDIFNLKLEEKENINIGNILSIYDKDDFKVGSVIFNDNDISITTDCLYGRLIGNTNYAVPSCSVGSLVATDASEMLSTWKNSFAFSLKLFNGNVGNCIIGNMTFDIIKGIDNDISDKIIPRFRFGYSDYEKTYNLSFNNGGHTFAFYEKRGTTSENILYNSSEYSDSYISYEKKDLLENSKYKEISSIKESWNNEGKHKLIMYKEFNGSILQNSVQNFDVFFSKDGERRFNSLNIISQKLRQLKNEFDVDGVSFVDKLIICVFSNHSGELISSVLDIDMKGLDLHRMYFDDVKNKRLVKK